MKRLILILTGIAVVGVLAAWLYYRQQNAAEDPRVSKAREFLLQFDRLMREGKYTAGFPLLDSAESIYGAIPCYSESYEMGVIENNRASAWLGMALYTATDSVQKTEWLFQAGLSVRKAIHRYQQWYDRFNLRSKEEINKELSPCFTAREVTFTGLNHQKILSKRIEDIELAKVENPRRLSVAWSNLGIIQRHQLLQDSAIDSYMTALKLWKRNPVAKNNLNTLLGRPQEDESIINQLFPPDRRKPD